MNDKEINQLITQETNSITKAMHDEIIQLHLHYQKRIDDLEKKINSLTSYVKQLQIETGAY